MTLRVAIDARLEPGMPGGVQQTIIGLAAGLAELDPGDEEYAFLAYRDAPDWLGTLGGSACRFLFVERAPSLRPSGWRALAAPISRLPVVRRAAEQGPLGYLVRAAVPESDGVIERESMQVVHFTMQTGFRTAVPSIYAPHDLQHLHHPGFFSPAERRWRQALYPALCAQARAVVALSRWGKDDLVRQLGLEPERVRVIGWAPVLDAYPTPSAAIVAEVRAARRLEEPFALYPAQTFRHKNHLRLLDAIALARDRHGVRIPFVFTGRKTELFARIERRIEALRLGAQVRFVGFVEPIELQSLYRSARMLVFPSEFEGFGLPVVEAMRVGVPVACSDVTSLPEVAGGAAALFDPTRPDAIAEAMCRVWTDEALRGSLVRAGQARVRGLTWRAVAQRYRALYRLVGGAPLSAEDRELLAAML